MTWWALLGVLVAWAAGAGVVAGCWNRRSALPGLEWVAMAGLLGPCVTGAALLAAGSIGLPARTSIPIITAASIAAGLAGAWRRWRALPRATGAPLALLMLVAVSVGWSTWLASRTHLGWDGTVVWYHKARIVAASDGRMPSATLADPTRIWMAPDYPLHVPLAMGWIRLWQPVEDERAIKVLPAAWCAALLMLVAAAVLERSGSATRAACALVMVAAAPRLLIGEGSYTSGYADGPLAGLVAALVWLVWRDQDDSTRGWWPLAAIVAVAVVWTKQEGVIAAMAAGATCAWQRRSVRPLAVAAPALIVAGAWQAWVATRGAVTGMAYAWPGIELALARWPVVFGVYAETWADLQTWGVLWPGLAALIAAQRRQLPAAAAIVAATACAGALAFLTSGWPDVRSHLLVTVPRLHVALAASLVLIALGIRDRDAAG